jgi:hypothetical protein
VRDGQVTAFYMFVFIAGFTCPAGAGGGFVTSIISARYVSISQ